MAPQQDIPRDSGDDNTEAFLSEGYLYVTNRRKQFNRDMFKTNILGGQEVVCIAGKEAAKVFYDNEKFKRDGAAPDRVLNTLFGQDGVQTLDDEKHDHRKTMFMSFMTKDSLTEIADLVEEEWVKALEDWEKREQVVLYEEVKKILTIAVCRWTGVPIDDKNIDTLSEQLADLYEAAAKTGKKIYKGEDSRTELETWIEGLIESIRTGYQMTEEGTPLHEIALHRDLEDSLLDKHTAAVEVLNLLRPTVAISVYIALSALALHNFPEEKEKLKNADKAYYKMFVQETRRYYPFFPVAPAVVKKDFHWDGNDFKEGTLVLLDLYGNTHHPDLWKDPDAFYPERFKGWDRSPFDLIPQGGGDYITGHRCAGEWLTIEVMKKCLDILVNKMDYTVPKQDLTLAMNQMPTVPASLFVMENIKRR